MGVPPHAGKPRVLVVEDNIDTQTLVKHLLRREYEVDIAADGKEAVAMAKETAYDLLLVDINLGNGHSGEYVLHELRALSQYKAVPMIAVTAYAMPGDRERFLEEGFDHYVSKPFTKQQLMDTLNAALAS